MYMEALILENIRNTARAHTPGPVGSWRYCSALLPLVERDGVIYVLYEVRSQELDVQPGEVSFPGGGIEEGETPAIAALRETVEELGLPTEAVEIVSELDYLISHGNIILYCFLGVIDADALAKASVNRAEVKDYFLVPLAWLMEKEPEVYVNTILSEPAAGFPIEKLAPGGNYNWRKGTSEVPIYTWFDPAAGEERIIWGMTGRLTMAFVELCRNVLAQ